MASYSQKFGNYAVRFGGLTQKWFKDYAKAKAYFDFLATAPDEWEDDLVLVDIKTGEVLEMLEMPSEEQEEAAPAERTVKEWIIEYELCTVGMRYEKLVEIGAPQVMLKGIEKQIEELRTGEIRIAGDTELLSETILDFEQKTGRGGKVYYSINNDTIHYFPNARYGRYIKAC